jgi:hypothetical protein
MLLSRLCADEFGVLWSYFLTSSEGEDDGSAPDNIDSIRAELAAVVDERRRRELCRPVLVSDLLSLQRLSGNQIAEQTTQIAEQSNQIAVLANQNAEQTNQIAGLERLIVEQNQQMQEQIRQIDALLETREQEQSTDVDARDSRAAKRPRTSR